MASKKSGGWQKLEIDGGKNESGIFGKIIMCYCGIRRRRAHLGPIRGGTLGALGPIWGESSGRPKADIMEAEGRLNGGLGAEPPGIKKTYVLFCLRDLCQVYATC